jgi:hypothetical protein
LYEPDTSIFRKISEYFREFKHSDMSFVLKESDIPIFREIIQYFRRFMVSDMIINVFNEPDAFIFRGFIYDFRGFIVSHMISNVSNRFDASTFKEFTEIFNGSMEEMQNVSVLTGDRSQSAGDRAYTKQKATRWCTSCLAGEWWVRYHHTQSD